MQGPAAGIVYGYIVSEAIQLNKRSLLPYKSNAKQFRH